MEKKKYSKPETLVVELKHRSYILEGSPIDPDDGSGSEIPGDNGDSNGSNSITGLW